MSVAAEVKRRIESMKEGVVISYQSFCDLESRAAVALTLSRLCKEEMIRRLEKGKYYKPKRTRFGDLDPSDTEVIKGLMNRGAYIAGAAAYNQLGLTNQVPNEITINSKMYSRRTKIGKLNIKYVQDPKAVSSGHSQLLQILDAFKNIKRIPDKSVEEAFNTLCRIVWDLSDNDKKSLTRLAAKFKPSVRAMVGAILERTNEELSQKLKDSLNPLSVYKIGLVESELPNLGQWRIQ